MVTFRNNNNNRRNNFRRSVRNFKSNGDNSKYGSNFSNNDNSEKKADDNLEKHLNSEAPVDAN